MLLVAAGRRPRCPVIAASAAAQQGHALPRRSADGRRNRARNAHAGDRPHGLRLRGLIVVMWRAVLRISETLALTESTSTRIAARSWCVTARATSVARSAWTSGDGNCCAPG